MTTESALLRDLLVFSRDGEWGSGAPGRDLVEMRVIRGTDFNAVRQGTLESVPTRFIPCAQADRKSLQAGDVLIETAGGTKDQPTGRTLLIKAEHLRRFGAPSTCASFARFLRFDPKRAHSGYVFWWLQSLYAAGEMEPHQVQHTGVARFQFTRFADTVHVPLPPLSVQEATASVLGALDDKIELNRRTNETLEATARALFQSWFVDFDPVRAKAEGRAPVGMDAETAAFFPDAFERARGATVPTGWRRARLSDITSTQYGFTASASTQPVGPKFLRITDINKVPWIDWSSVPYCCCNDEQLAKYRLSVGDILVSRMADPGKAGIVERETDAVFASYLVRLRVPAAYRYFSYYFLTSPQYLAYAEAVRSGSAQQNMNARVITAVELVTPPAPIAGAFESLVTPLRRRLVAAIEENEVLAGVRNLLLPKLLSGELRVSDAEKVVGRVA